MTTTLSSSSASGASPADETSVHTLVVGTGPAGILAALGAAAAGPVLMVDRFTLPRDKSCGGMIHPLSQQIFAEMGATMPDDLLLDPQTVYFRYNDWDKHTTYDTKLGFLNVDRKPFDEWMTSLVDGKADIWDACEYRDHEQTPDGRLRVRLNARGQERFVTCDWLIGADGSRSRVRRALGLAPFDCYVTVQDYCLRSGPVDAVFDCFWTKEVPDLAIGYVIPKNERALVGLIYYPGTKRAHEQQDHALEVLRQRLNIGESIKREAWSALKHRNVRDIVSGRGQVLLVGEAGGFLSPTSGEGISWALDSGRSAGRAIAAGGVAEEVQARHRRGTAHLRRMIAWRLRIYPVMNSRWGKTLFGITPKFLIESITNHI
ncbi:MAG: FAD-dependent monooxygenase [Coriobacteriia bacterium]|nr:FAD-dependent monooxygenase [Coriobacteriia bacterium]